MSNRQIAQSRPANTSAASIVNEDRPWSLSFIVITNTGSTTADYSIFHDADGTTYGTGTALAYEIAIGVGEMHTIELPIRNDNRLGNLAVQSSVADTITFSVYGEIEGERR